MTTKPRSPILTKIPVETLTHRWWCSECRGLLDGDDEDAMQHTTNGHHAFRVKPRPRFRTDMPIPGHYYDPVNPEIGRGLAFGPILLGDE